MHIPLWKSLLTIFLLIFVLPPLSHATTLAQVKAAFIFKFAYYASWSDDTVNENNSPLNFCVAGSSEILELLALTAENERVYQKPVKVMELETPAPIKTHCHILFIGHDYPKPITTVLEQFPMNTLLVSDIEDFSRNGGMIELRYLEGKLKLFINYEKAKRANIQIRSALLALAIIVE